MPEPETPNVPPPDQALVQTLEALTRAVGATLAVTNCRSEFSRETLAIEADEALRVAADRIAELAQTSGDNPTLFGRNVGDGLAAEREDARQAVDLLRSILVQNAYGSDSDEITFGGSLTFTADQRRLADRLVAGQPLPRRPSRDEGEEAVRLLRTLLLDHTLRSEAQAGRVVGSFAGSRIFTPEEVELATRLTGGRIHDASVPLLERFGQGSIALSLLRQLLGGLAGTPALLAVSKVRHRPGQFLEAMPGHPKLYLTEEEAALIDALSPKGE